MYYEFVFKTLNNNKVKYLVAGGMAINLHGIPRFTKDLDLLIDQSLANLSKLAKSLKKLGFKPKVPVSTQQFLNPENWAKWKKEKGMIALNFYNPKTPFEEIDLLIYTPVSYADAYRKRVRTGTKDIRLNLVSLLDLIKMKRKAGREQDKADIKSIRKLLKMRIS